MRWLKRGLLVAAVVLALAGCNVGTHVVVHPDGSGTYSTVLTVANGPDNAGEKLFQAVKAAAAKSDVPLPVERYSEGGEDGAKISYEFRSLDDLKAEADRLAKVGSGLGGIQIARGDAGWQFSAASSEGLAQAAGAADNGAFNPAQLGQVIHLSVVVELPGAPAANNATTVSHTDETSAFTWKLDVGSGTNKLDASTAFVGDQGDVELATALTPVASGAGAGSSSSNAPLLVGGVVIALAALGGGALVTRRRRAGA